MAEFSVKVNVVRETVDTEERLRKELENIQQSIREISGSLVIKTAAFAGVRTRLNSLAGSVASHQNGMENMKNALERTAGRYEEAERNICGFVEGGVKKAGSQTSETDSAFWNDLTSLFGKISSRIGEIVQGIFSPLTTIWSHLVSIVEGIIGNGVVTDHQPTVPWLTGIAGLIDWTSIPATTEDTTNTVDSGMVVADSNVDYINSVGQQVVHVVDENGNFRPPYSKYSAPGRYTFGNETDKMQCVGYAWGRMEELTGRPVNFSCGTAKNIVNTYQGNSALELVNDIGNIRPPALAVVNPGGHFGGGPMLETGHVVVVEAVYPKGNGTYDIYFSEGNSYGKKDGTLGVVNSSQVDGCTGYVQFN